MPTVSQLQSALAGLVNLLPFGKAAKAVVAGAVPLVATVGYAVATGHTIDATTIIGASSALVGALATYTVPNKGTIAAAAVPLKLDSAAPAVQVASSQVSVNVAPDVAAPPSDPDSPNFDPPFAGHPDSAKPADPAAPAAPTTPEAPQA